MPAQYSEQLYAIRELLKSSSKEIMQEAYDLLFDLWLANYESSEFGRDLIQDAIEHSQLISELRKRHRELPLRDSITDAYLQKRLEDFATNVANFKLNASIESQSSIVFLPAKINMPENQSGKYTWWQILLLFIILISVGLVISLPHIYQKLIVIVISTISIAILPYLLSRKNRMISVNLPGIKLNYSLPTYLSLGEVNTIHISVENLSQTKFNAEITLIFKDPVSFVVPAPDQSLSVKVQVPYNGREAKQFQFRVLKRPADSNLDYYFQISADKAQFESNTDSFLIAPVPYLRSTWAWLFGSAGLSALILALLWDQLKKLLGL